MKLINKIDLFLDETAAHMRKVMQTFRTKYPQWEPGQFDLNIRDMEDILRGTKVYPNPQKAKRKSMAVQKKELEKQEILAWANKALRYAGDIALDYADGDLRKMENLSKKDQRSAYYDAVDTAGYRGPLTDKIVKVLMNWGVF